MFDRARKTGDDLGYYAKDNLKPSVLTPKLRTVIDEIAPGPIRSFLVGTGGVPC
jgi:hypothetical protein